MALVNIVAYDAPLRRFYVRASGMWEVSHALHFHHQMADAVRQIRQDPAPAAKFVDLRGLMLHTSDVAGIIEASVAQWEDVPLSHYAMIVDGALMRMQSRRLNGSLDALFFDRTVDALSWLGWTQDYVEALGALPDAA